MTGSAYAAMMQQMASSKSQDNNAPECYRANHSSTAAKLGFVASFNYQLDLCAKIRKGGTTTLRTSTRPAIEHGIAPSVSSIHDLHQTTIHEVTKKVNHIHSDSVMFLTIIHAPYREIATNILVEDKNLDCIMLSLYNFVGDDEEPVDVFPVGTRLALLAPYMKNSQDDRSKNLMLRCDNPQCVILYDDDHSWRMAQTFPHSELGGDGNFPIVREENPSILRKKGNDDFRRGSLVGAYRFYTRAINAIEKDKASKDCIHIDDKIACLSNRAEVNLRLGQWEDAAEDAQSVLLMQKDNEKAKLRLAKAILRLGRVTEALALGNEIITASHQKDAESQSPSKVMKDFINECRRLRLEQCGSYDYESMRKEERDKAGTCRLKHRFHADFASTNVEFGSIIQLPSGTSYRGCKAATDIAAGELLSASKAFAYTDENSDPIMSFERDIYGKTSSKQSDIQLLAKVVRVLWKRPAQGRHFYLLSGSGDADDEHVDDWGKVDLKRIRSILNSNSFSQTNESDSVSRKWEEKKKVKAIGFAATRDKLKADHAVGDATRGTGLWLTESMFNHSCAPNCTWTQIGDQMFIRSTRPIDKGEELCVSYTSMDKTYDERKDIFANWIRPNVGFSCACDCCRLFQANDDLRMLAIEVNMAYQKAAEDVSMRGIPMADAADNAIPPNRRKAIIQKFEHLPLRQQNSISKLYVMDGTCIKSHGDDIGALKAFEKVVEIGYAVRGGESFDYFVDLWRVVGASMACRGCTDLAYSSLTKIWNAREFQSLPTSDIKAAFKDLTLHYSMPWWKDRHDFGRQAKMEKLIKDVWNEKAPKSEKLSKGKKKKKKKGPK